MKDEQFVEEMQEEFKRMYPNMAAIMESERDTRSSSSSVADDDATWFIDFFATIIKRSFAHRDEQWREKIEDITKNAGDRLTPWNVVDVEELLALLTNNDN